VGLRTGLVVLKIVPAGNQSPVRPAQSAIIVPITLSCVTSGFRRDVGDIRALLGFLADVSGRSIAPIFKCQEVRDFLTLVGYFLTIEKDGADRFPETSVRNYHSTLHYAPQIRYPGSGR